MKRLLAYLLSLALMAFPALAIADSQVYGAGGGGGWVEQTDCSGVIAEGAGCWDTDDDVFYVGDGTTATAVGPGTAGSVAFGNILTGTNTTALTMGSGGTLTFGGSGIINASQYKGTSAPTSTEFGYLGGVTSAIQTQFNAKAPLASPTLTGTVTFPSPFTLGATSVTATGTELNYVSGVTSAIQTQLNGKASTSHSQAETTITFTDITTGNASSSTHGYLRKLPGAASQFLNGLGNWVSGLMSTDAMWDAKGDLAVATGADAAQKLTVGANSSILTADSAQTTGLAWMAKGANNSILGVNDSGVLGFYTTMYLDVPWAVGTSAPPTAEGQAYWDSSTDTLTVGTGSGSVALLSTGGTLSVAQGGTGKSSWTQYAIPYASATTTLSEIGIGTAGQYLKVNATTNGYEWGNPAGSGDVLGPATHAANYIPQWNGTPNSKTLVEGKVAPAGTIVGTSDTQTLTNKTLDVEGTGNLVTIPVKLWFAAAGCNNTTASSFWDLPTSNPAVAACSTGTNTQKGTLDFADGSVTLSAQTSFMLPGDFSASGTLSGIIKWFSTTTSGNVVWNIQTSCVADGETDDPSWNAESYATDPTKGTASQLNDVTISAIDTSGCAAGEFMHVKVYRDPTLAGDTMAGTARMVGVELTYRRAM